MCSGSAAEVVRIVSDWRGLERRMRRRRPEDGSFKKYAWHLKLYSDTQETMVHLPHRVVQHMEFEDSM